MSAAEFLDGLDAARAAGTRHAHEPECCEQCEAGERFHAGAVCAGAGCDPLVQCLRCRMPLPNHMPHDADCDAVLTLTAPVLAEARKYRALRKAVEALADEWERGATRWETPLAVPPEVAQLRAVLADAPAGDQ